MAEKVTANIGFEKQIWEAACVLRGNLDAAEYKSVVLGLIFLKYISDRFEDKYQQLVEEGDGFEEDVDEYISEGIFFVPENARWSVIASKAHTAEIGTVIDDAMRAIEKENKRLKDILPKNFARPELDKHCCFVSKFTDHRIRCCDPHQLSKLEYPTPKCRTDLHGYSGLTGSITDPSHLSVFTKLIIYRTDQTILELNGNLLQLAAVHFECLLGVTADAVTQSQCLLTNGTRIFDP